MAKKRRTKSDRSIARSGKVIAAHNYSHVLSGITNLLATARRAAARSVNAVMTATYWEIGRRIVEFEQGGVTRAEYGERLIERLAIDLTSRFGRGFGRSNLFQMRAFYLSFPQEERKVQTASGQFAAGSFPLPWSHYVRLLSVDNQHARRF